MTGISYEVRIEAEEARARLAELVSRMENRQGFFKNVGEHLLAKLSDRFEAETAPDGSPWQRLSPVTITKRLEDHGNAPLTILRVSGALAGSFNYEAGDDEVRIGSPIVYAAIHHFGGQAGRNRKVTIPVRPILGLAPDDEQAITEMAEDWLAD